jgi:hypothetical protein
VPAALTYQGVLLDGAGQPRTGTVDLVVRIYDELLAGTLLYKQSFTAVPLADGVFSVALGPTGSASDVPTAPLTTSLATALSGDLLAIGPGRFVELTVGAEDALPRTQALAVPFALRAETAGTATSAETAAVALDVASVNGLPPEVVSEIYEHYSFDGGGPPNTDPLEGVGDVDLDGIANFMDSDNDGDGLSDAVEQGQSGVNLVTPTLTGSSPTSGLANSVFNVSVQGTSFQPGLAVQFGSQTPTPSNVTPTSFLVAVGPQPAGVVNVQVTLPNGEQAPTPRSFTFAPASFDVTDHLTFAVQALANYVIGGNDSYSNGAQAFPFPSDDHLAVAWDAAGRLATLRCLDVAGDCEVRVGRDANADFLIAPSEETTIETIAGGVAPLGTIRNARLTFDPAGHPVASYSRRGNGEVRLARDDNGDGDFADPGEQRTVATLVISDEAGAGDLAVDSSGRVAIAWYDPVNDRLRLAWDRSGDGDFNDTVGGNPETFNLITTIWQARCTGLGFDSAGRLGAIYSANAAGEIGPTLRYDLNADGDFNDAGETTAFSAIGANGCDVAGHATPGLAVTHDVGGLQLLVDRNGDDDFADADEEVLLAPSGSGPFAPIALGRDASGKASVATRSTVFPDPTP